MESSAYDLIIIGGGPAGLTAALYAGRSRLKTVILEKMGLGGRILMSQNIENFPGFIEDTSTVTLIEGMKRQIMELDVKVYYDEVIGIDCKEKSVKTSSLVYCASAIILATGAKPRKLDVPGEDEFIGKGISYCATCDAPFYKEKDIIVVGGGNAVAEEALYLARFASSVTILHRRDQMRASAILQEELKKNKKIKFMLNSIITQVEGSNKLESIKVKDVVNESEKTVDCDGVFVYIGYDPDTGFLNNKLKLDESGFIITDEQMATSEKGIFACGDCRRKPLYQVITACGDGAIAGDSAYKYIASLER